MARASLDVMLKNTSQDTQKEMIEDRFSNIQWDIVMDKINTFVRVTFEYEKGQALPKEDRVKVSKGSSLKVI